MEFLNPGGTPKDRVAASIVKEAVQSGRLKRGGTVVEGTSGSTGIALAMAARAYGCKCEVVLPDDQSMEKEIALQRLGAKVHRVKCCSIVSDNHYVNVARRLGSRPGCIFGNQFETLANYRAHLATTGPEIWRQCGGRLDAFVMGAGTGGTIAGVSRALADLGVARTPRRGRSPRDDASRGAEPTSRATAGPDADSAIKQSLESTRVEELRERGDKVRWVGRSGAWVLLADPPGSSLLHKVKHGVCYAPQQAERAVRRHRYDSIVEGVGLDRLTRNFRQALVDDGCRVSDGETTLMARRLLREEGLFVGSSAAMNVAAARRLALAMGPGHRIVTVLCDSGSRHVSRFWSESWMRKHGFGAQLDAAQAAEEGRGEQAQGKDV